MHEEKIWAMDFAETHKITDEENPEENSDQRPNLMMVTGGSDSKIKVW